MHEQYLPLLLVEVGLIVELISNPYQNLSSAVEGMVE